MLCPDSEAGLAAAFARRHSAGAAHLLTHSVATSTQLQYAPAWRRWKVFVSALSGQTITAADDESRFLPADLSTHETARLLAMFIHYMTFDLGLSAESVTGHMSALRYHFRRHYCDSPAFENPQVLACKKAVFLDPMAYRPSSRQTSPATLAMVESIIAHFTRPSLHKRVVAVATALAFCCLLRPSEYCQTRRHPTGARHILRANSVLFERVEGGTSVFHSAATLPSDFTFDQCQSVKLLFLTAKNITLRTSRTVWFSTANTAVINLPRIMFDWAKVAALHPADPFLSFRRPGSTNQTVLNYHRMNSILKFTARLRGLDPSHVSCHSLRVGGASLLRAAGASDRDICTAGRWKSVPACVGYHAPSTITYDRLLHLVTSRDCFTDHDVLLAQATGHSTAAAPLATTVTTPRACHATPNPAPLRPAPRLPTHRAARAVPHATGGGRRERQQEPKNTQKPPARTPL